MNLMRDNRLARETDYADCGCSVGRGELDQNDDYGAGAGAMVLNGSFSSEFMAHSQRT